MPPRIAAEEFRQCSPSRCLCWLIEDWPTHLHDYTRAGRTSESISTPLANIWTFVSANAPDAAWEAPIPGVLEGNLEVNRVDYDNAFQVSVGGDNVHFGSSSDDQVYCLDLKLGKIRWTFFAEGPVIVVTRMAICGWPTPGRGPAITRGSSRCCSARPQRTAFDTALARARPLRN